MKKLIFTLLLLLAVVCTAAACADNSAIEPPAGNNPAGNPSESITESTAESGAPADTEKPDTAADTAAETAPTDDPRRIQFPLTSADDTTSYVSLPDVNAGGPQLLEFFIEPALSIGSELVSAFKLPIRANGENNLQVIACTDREDGSYRLIFMLESVYSVEIEGRELHGIDMQCSSLSFVPDKIASGIPNYYLLDGGDSVHIEYHEDQRESMLNQHRNANRAALERSENLIDKYSDTEKYEYTVLYSYIDGVETINTPVESIPEFPFAIFNEYGFDN